MIQEIVTYSCRMCGSTNIIKNGTNRFKQQQYYCKDCGTYRVPVSKREAKKEKTDHPQSLSRTNKFARFGTYLRCSSPKHFKMDHGSYQKLTKAQRYFAAVSPNDVLEYDEAWSFVFKKRNKRWLWTVMCRRTRQIIAFAIGDRSEKTCRQLWKRVPEEYRGCVSYSDFWEAYQKVLPDETHHPVGKDSGKVSHMERGTAPCVSIRLTMSEKLSHFPKRMLSITW